MEVDATSSSGQDVGTKIETNLKSQNKVRADLFFTVNCKEEGTFKTGWHGEQTLGMKME